MINQKRMVEEFCKLVSIDAISFEERQMADELTSILNELGFAVTEDQAGEHYGGNSGNLYGFLQGTLEGDPILFSAHMDTVTPGKGKKAVVHEDGAITSDGTTILGSDDLSGIVAILEAVRSIQEQGIPHRSIEVLFPIGEEVYLRGSDVFDYSLIKAKQAYVLDLSGPVGTAALSAPTLVSFETTLHGKAAHAGFAPETGIHAIALAAKAITQITQGRIDETTTVNIGTIEGGKARNIVPDSCILKGEVRSLSHEKALKEAEKIKEVLDAVTKEAGVTHSWETSFGCLAYRIPKEDEVVKRYQEVCDALGYETYYVDTFGGSDNNNFVKNGIQGIVLACGMNKVHSLEEYTHVEELTKCASIVFKLMTKGV
jgi:tripeptide aminopeptidase